MAVAAVAVAAVTEGGRRAYENYRAGRSLGDGVALATATGARNGAAGALGGEVLGLLGGRLAARMASQAAGTAYGTVGTGELVSTHGQTDSRRAMRVLQEDIAENGMREPIRYVEHDGVKYVVDGHHRLRAAQRLGMKEVPAEQVSLPYAGYRRVEDLNYSP